MLLNDILGPDVIIDAAKLGDVDIVALGKYLSDSEVRERLVQRINYTARAHLLGKNEVPGHVPAFTMAPDIQPTLSAERWFSTLRSRVRYDSAKGSVISVLLPTAVYLHDCYGLSCSKLILGCETEMTPPLWLRSWLYQAERLSSSQIQALYDILEAGSVVRQDVVYTLKSRVQELAGERGALLPGFFLFPGIRYKDMPTVEALANATFQETGNLYEDMKLFLGNHAMLRFIVSLHLLYGVSPDYLLLQDYSEFVVDQQGRYYAPAARQLMSLLLRTDEKTRMKAVSFVFAGTALRVAQGGEVPVLPDGAQMVDRQTHMMGVYVNAANNAASKNESDEQIVEALKKRVYEVLSLSGEPVSNTRIFQIVPGHFRLTRKALQALEEEGKVVSLRGPDNHTFWQLAGQDAKKAPKKSK